MKKLPLFALLLFVACSQGPSADDSTAVADRTVVEVVIDQGEPMATADLTIGGMSCSMMCGNMIKGALAKVPGVTQAEVEYTDGSETGHAKVTYDPAQVDDGQLVSAVQALADGQYKVSAVAVKKQVKHASARKDGNERSASLIPEVPMPNLVGMLRALVRI
ncbi:MAG: heavy-metal-associated domain-containing protein [Flavobacteriales bacterium]|nr:heavy-metal-associated domain-containing protein [Flavobacteriales bacterium]MBP9080295.1 heavy-metal-associated domain-containing protein [Flavobacteriales bacterium]